MHSIVYSILGNGIKNVIAPNQGGVTFEEDKKLGTGQVVAICCRTPIPKYQLLKLLTFGGARPQKYCP